MDTQEASKQNIQAHDELALTQYVQDTIHHSSNTRQIYQKVAYALFTQYQEVPTPTRLYALVRKGSMSTVVEELKLFWQRMQQDWHMRLHMPKIPDALHMAYQENIEKIWQVAHEQSENIFQPQREQYVQQVAHLQQALQHEQEKYDDALLQNQQLQKYLDELEEKYHTVRQQFDAYQQTQQQHMRQVQDDHVQALQHHHVQQQTMQAQHTEKVALLEQQLQHWQRLVDKERQHAQSLMQKWQEQAQTLKQTQQDLQSLQQTQHSMQMGYHEQIQAQQARIMVLEHQMQAADLKAQHDDIVRKSLTLPQTTKRSLGMFSESAAGKKKLKRG